MNYKDIVKDTIEYKYIIDEKDISHICYGINDDYVRCVATSIVSICINNLNRNFVFHILIDSLNDINKRNLKKIGELYKVNIIIYIVNNNILNYLPIKEKWGIAMYYRLFFPFILKNINKILYLDADVICLKNAEKLFMLNMDNKIIGVVPDKKEINDKQNKILGLKEHIYFNSGVMLIDVKKWNEFNVFNKFIKIIQEKQKEIYYIDQDILNIILSGNIKYISSIYNCKEGRCREGNENIVLYHFSANPKPWDLAWKISKISNNFNRDLYSMYEEKTPYKNEPLVYPKKAYQIRSYVKALFYDKQYLKAIYWLFKYFWISKFKLRV